MTDKKFDSEEIWGVEFIVENGLDGNGAREPAEVWIPHSWEKTETYREAQSAPMATAPYDLANSADME